MALIYPQNGDLTKLLKSARKKVPQSARLSAGGGAKAKRAMPKCLRHEFEGGFPNPGNGISLCLCCGVSPSYYVSPVMLPCYVTMG